MNHGFWARFFGIIHFLGLMGILLLCNNNCKSENELSLKFYKHNTHSPNFIGRHDINTLDVFRQHSPLRAIWKESLLSPNVIKRNEFE